MKSIEIGQILYVTRMGTFTNMDPNLTEYEVIKVNNSSVYAHKTDSDYVIRLDKKTMTHNRGIGYQYKAYLTAEEYWSLVSLNEEKEALRSSIQSSLIKLEIDTLRKIDQLINS